LNDSLEAALSNQAFVIPRKASSSGLFILHNLRSWKLIINSSLTTRTNTNNQLFSSLNHSRACPTEIFREFSSISNFSFMDLLHSVVRFFKFNFTRRIKRALPLFLFNCTVYERVPTTIRVSELKANIKESEVCNNSLSELTTQ
jgi:hypothetical protein